jgi:uncharacterized protein YrrD
MDTKIQFQKNAVVLSADGQQVGSLNRVVVDPNTRVLTDIVVRTGALFNHEERVVPLEFIAETTADQIVLREEAGDLKTLPPFEEEHIVDTEENTGGSPGEIVQPLGYGSPVIGTPMPTTIGEEFVTRIDQNIPEGSVAVKEGAKVISADGKNVGDVERIFTGIPNEQITHLLISRGKLSKKTKLLPIEWVDNLAEDEVTLRVNKVSVDNLADTTVPQ